MDENEHTEFDLDSVVNAFVGEDDDDASFEDDDNEELEDGDYQDDDDDGDDVDDDESEQYEDDDDDEAEDDDLDGDDRDESGDDDEASDDDDAPVADPNSYVEVKVGDETQRVKVSDLQRLAGQEKSLTQKGQELANARREVEKQGMYMSNLLQNRWNAAKEKADKYANVDLFKASRELDAEDFDALRAAKEEAEAELNQITQEGQEFMQKANESRNELLRSQAQESIKVLKEQIPDWSDQLYGDIRSYAVSQGMDQNAVNEIVDPSAIQMIYKAMKHDDAQKAGTEKVRRKVSKSPKRVAKKSSKTSNPKERQNTKARQKAQMTGDIDDVLAVFAADQEL